MKVADYKESEIEPKLWPRQAAFCVEYPVDFNGTQAAIRAGYSEKGASQQASALLAHPKIQARIEQRKAELAATAGVNKKWLLNQWLEIATANPNDLVCNRHVNCRHCWGFDHKYQWRQVQFFRELEEVQAYNKSIQPGSKKRKKPEPDCSGGFNFRGNREPNPECPICDGEGVEEVRVADTRKLTGGALRLYQGVQKTKEGIKVNISDQAEARKNIAAYLGMNLTRTELTGKDGEPLLPNEVKDMTKEQLLAILNAADVE